MNTNTFNRGGLPEVLPDKTDAGTAPQAKRSSLCLAISLLIGALPFMLMPSNAAAVPAVSVQKDVGGFPTWYQDVNDVRLTLCYDPNDANCVAPVSATYDPNLPLAMPGNYPDELFYSAADSDLVVVNDSASCPGFTQAAVAGANGSRIHMALEASFLNGEIVPGDQMVFGRLRVISRGASGLCPASWYTFRTPYGPITLQTDQNAEIQGAVASAATSDTGCLPGPVSPCNFDLALGSPVMGVGLIRQVNNAAPGYLGSGLGLDLVSGGLNGFNQFDVVKWPAGVTPGSSGVGVDCENLGCTVLGSSNQFSVAAKLAGPIGAVAGVDFGGQPVGTVSPSQVIVLTNLGSGPLGLDGSSISDIRINGANANDFSLLATDCPAEPLPRDHSCNVSVAYAPQAAAASTASLDVTVAGSSIVSHVALKGTGTVAGQVPVAQYLPADGNVDFGAVRLTTAGPVKTVTVSNSGTAPLGIVPNLAGSSAFSIVYDSCSGAFVPAAGSCSIGLKYIPTVLNPVSAQLRLDTNAAGGAFTFDLLGHGTGGVAAVSPIQNAVNSFPEWYQDENGLRVGQCDDPANTLCVAAPVAGLVTFPSNYPDEWFYYLAQSAPMSISDPVCGVEAGPIFVEAGMEAAFLGPIAPNQGITFGRLRIVSRGGLCPNTQYQLTHPYGQSILTTDSLGNIKPAAGTTDVGCLGAPCDYAIALSAPVAESFLTQSVRPDGYLGDPVAPSTVTGAPYIDQSGQPANYFKVERLDNAGTGHEIGFTTQFGVSGRLVGPMIASPVAEEFGGAEVGLESAAVSKTITFSNDGPFAVSLAASEPLTVEGVQAADYTILPGSDCTPGKVLSHAQSCTADVRFLPLATGDRTASLKIHHSGGNNPLAVALHGIGNSPAGTAAISTNISPVKFTDLRVGLHSESVLLTLSNVGGSSALWVDAPSITADAPFVINGNSCANIFVQPNKVCTLSVQFQPTTVGDFSATLTIPSNAQSGTLLIPLQGKSTNVATRQSASNNEAGLPSWYQDGNGLRVEPCLVQNGNCVLLADATFDPSLPVAWPSNFPGESFYNLTDSELITLPADSSCGAAGGLALLRIGTEAAFATLPPAAGGQSIFNRIRIVAGGLCPNTTYNFTHPYGVSSLVSDGNGDIRPKDGTFDIPNVLTSAPMTPGLLQWDPNVAPFAPQGYLGDGRSLHRIVGSQYRPIPGGEPANYFRIAVRDNLHNGVDGKVVGETNMFTVSGRIAGPVVSSLDLRDFGTWEMDKQSDAQDFVFTNIGSTPVSAISVALNGTDANLFVVNGNVANSCSTVGTLDVDQSCTVQVRFAPTTAAGAGAKSATLSLGHNGLRSPVNVGLKGAGIAAGTPALSVTPATLSFGSLALNSSSAPQLVSIRNSGSGDLHLGALALGGANPGQYSMTTTCPNGQNAAVLHAGEFCTLSVAFAPTSKGAKPAAITVTATDAITAGGHVPVTINPVNVGLSGTGAQGTISLSASTLAVSSPAGRTSTVKVTLTNTGTAPFSLVGTPFYSLTAISGNNPVPKFSAAQTACSNVAVGKNCSVTVSFTPPTGTARNTVFSVNMVMTSNASNSSATVRVNGTVK